MNTNLEDYIKERRKTSSGSVQPYILLIDGECQNFYVIVDGYPLQRYNKSDIISAFDLLFKVYYVLNLEYPINLKIFFNFIETYFFKVSKITVSSVVTSLNINLNSIA